MGTELLRPPIQNLEDLVNHTIVTIAIQNGKLSLYPRRSEDVVTYSTAPPDPAAPEKPREVRWIVRGKAPDQRIVIRPKEEAPRAFRTQYSIAGDDNTVVSGRTGQHPGRGHGFKWAYDVILYDGKGVEIDRIDPDVVVKSDP